MIPRMQDYDVDPVTGFLPREQPLRRLANPYFEPWEHAMDDFHGLLLAGQLRVRVHSIPVLDIAQLITEPERRRAYVILGVLSHGYVWGKHEPVSQV
jgi:indoleamine 2,3-dioxygenase